MRKTQQEYIKESKVFKKTLKNVQKQMKRSKYINKLEVVDLPNSVVIETNRHSYLFYTSKQNENRIFRSRIFNKESINSRVIGHGGSKNITSKFFSDKDVWLDRDEKVVTYMNTDIATTDNIIRQDKLSETLGYPFKRDIQYLMHLDGKDKLQYRRNCKELTYRDDDGRLKKGLDSAFISRVYRLFLRFQGMRGNELRDAYRMKHSISGYEIVACLKYIYTALKSYHPFFYKNNGLSKYNSEWFNYSIRQVEMYGLLDRDYKLGRCHKSLNTDKNIVKPKDIKFWRLQQEAQEQQLSKEDIKPSKSIQEVREQQEIEKKQAKKRMNEIIALHKKGN